MIYPVDSGFVISSQSVWMPGVYANRRAANYAFRFSDDELQALQDRENAANGGNGGVITFEMLQAVAKARR